MILPSPIRLKSPNGKVWGISAFEEPENYIRLYSREVDGIGEDFAIISSLSGKFRIKVNNKGRIYTYKMDDLDN